MDYLKYWQLLDRPFGHSALERCFCGASQAAATAAIERLICQDQAAGVLACEPGCGATSLMRRLSRSQGIGDRAVEVILTEGSADTQADAVERLAEAMGMPVEASDQPPEQLVHQIDSVITASGNRSVKVVWAIDCCTLPAARVATWLARLAPSFAAILVADPHSAIQFQQLLLESPTRSSRSPLRLGPLSYCETVRYVRESLRQVGGRGEIWTDSAVIRLYEVGQGRLATMSRAAEAAMMLAARHRMESVAAAMIDAAIAPQYAARAA